MTEITFLVHKGKHYTVQKYLESYGHAFAKTVKVRNYPHLRSTGRSPWKRLEQTVRSWRLGTFRLTAPPSGTRQIVVFTDHDRLDRRETEIAIDLWQAVTGHPDTALVLNHPVQSLQRFELLENLHAQGINQFAVYRAHQGIVPDRWPVFVRDANDHGFLSPLLDGPDALQHELARAAQQGSLATKIVVEFCGTADKDGIIRKYGAFRIGDRIIARQVHFSRDWVVRFPDLKSAESAREELAYVEENPHQEQLLEIFRLARIDYGRIDYSLLDGQIQVWEINTNPMILVPADRQDPLRRAAHGVFAKAFGEALCELSK